MEVLGGICILLRVKNRRYMLKNELIYNVEAVELLGIKEEKILCEVQRELEFLDINISVTCEQVKSILNNSMEVKVEEVEQPKEQTRRVYIRKGGVGKFYSVKNIKFYLVDFLEAIYSLLECEKDNRNIMSVFFLMKVLKQCEVELDDLQAIICIILYEETKQIVITDDNLTTIVNYRLNAEGYTEIGHKKIYDVIEELVDLGIVEITAGRYNVVQKLYVK